MKTVNIPEIQQAGQMKPRELIDALLKFGAEAPVDHQQWEEYRRDPEEVQVSCRLGYEKTNLYLYFQVKEPEIRAVNTSPHDPVYQDSCVECFVSVAGSDEYLNCEFNPLGACLAGIGTGRQGRTPLPAEEIQSLCLYASYRDGEQSSEHWDLLAVLPLGRWGAAGNKQSLAGMVLKGNLYSCGDKLKESRYISWNPILLDAPDFHQSRWFGEFRFASE